MIKPRSSSQILTPSSLACLATAGTALGLFLSTVPTVLADMDFGLKVQNALKSQSVPLFGVGKPLDESAPGPFTGANSREAIALAKGLNSVVISTAVDPQADQIALWPDDAHPTHLFVAVENFFSGNSPSTISVQRVDLSKAPDQNAETIVTGLSSCDPIRRTPWGTLIVGEEAGASGGFYEILDPLGISGQNPVVISDRATGLSSDPTHVVKRKALGSISSEGIGLLPDGTMYFGDENRPSKGLPGGGIFKFIPDQPYDPSTGTITDPDQSPFVSGSLFGLRVGTRSGNTDYGQGSETGRGIWVPVDPASYLDADQNIILRDAQFALGLTGYYRPEDMDLDPVAQGLGIVRLCWANTGRMSNGAGSAIEESGNYGEILALWDQPVLSATGGASPLVERFASGDPQANHFDNAALQSRSGRLVALEDGEVEVLNADGSLKELRGNDLWMWLPDGADRDVRSDGGVRIGSLRDTDSEPTGFIFDASGRNAYVNLQHRSAGQGALMKITGFKNP